MTEAVFSLVGVFLGFILSEGKRWLDARSLKKTLRAALLQELGSIVRMTPSKLDILEQAENAFGMARVMPTKSTRFPRETYGRVLINAPEILTTQERDCLHIIYERLRVIDDSMDTMEERFNSITATHSIGQALPALVNSIHDMKEALYQTVELAKSVIEGNAVDVYQVTAES